MGHDGLRVPIEIVNHVLILHLQHRAFGQGGAPMVHQGIIRFVVAAELAEVVAKGCASANNSE